MASHWLGPSLRCGLVERLEELGGRTRGSVGWADLRDCFTANQALNGRLPSELVYSLLRRFQNIFPADASAEEFHAVLLHHGFGPNHPQAKAFLAASSGGGSAVAPLALSLYMNAEDFARTVELMDPAGRIAQQLEASHLLLPASFASWLGRGEVDASAPQLEHMPANEQLMAQGLTTLVSDEEALVAAGAPPLTFLQRYALMNEARSWLAASKLLDRRLKAASAPVLDRGLALLVAPALAASALPKSGADVDRVAAARAREALKAPLAKHYVGANLRAYHPLLLGEPWPAMAAVQAFDGWADRSGGGAGESVAVLEVDGALLAAPSAVERTTRRDQLDDSLRARRLGREIEGLAQIWPDVPITSSDDDTTEYLPNGSTKCGGALVHLAEAAEPPPRYLVAERLQGWKSLRSLCHEKGFLGTAGGLSVLRVWARQIATTLQVCSQYMSPRCFFFVLHRPPAPLVTQELHATGVVLRDISTSNVFISPDGRAVKLGAFAHASLLTDSGRISSTAPALGGTFGGLPAALGPPEGPPESGRSADSWCLGLVLLEAVAGGLPPEEANTDGFFDFFSAMRTTVGDLASTSFLSSVPGGEASHDGAVTLVVDTPGDMAAPRLCASAVLKAIESMSTTVLLPRRVAPGSSADPQSEDLVRLEEAWARSTVHAATRSGGDATPVSWSDVRHKAASHFLLLLTERSEDGGSGSGPSAHVQRERVAAEVVATLRRRDKSGVGLLRPDQLRAALIDDLRYPLSEVRKIA